MTQWMSVTVSCLACWGSVLTAKMMNLSALVHSLRCSLLHIESRLLQSAGLDRDLGGFTDTSSGRQLTAANNTHCVYFCVFLSIWFRPKFKLATFACHLSLMSSYLSCLCASFIWSYWTDWSGLQRLEVNSVFPVCSSSAGCEWPQAPAAARPEGWAGGAAEPGAAPWPPRQHPVDGSTQEETHYRGQPHQEASWRQTPKSQGTARGPREGPPLDPLKGHFTPEHNHNTEFYLPVLIDWEWLAKVWRTHK